MHLNIWLAPALAHAHPPQHKGLKKAKEVRTQLLDIMQQHKVPIVSAGTDWDTVRKVRRSCWLAALFCHCRQDGVAGGVLQAAPWWPRAHRSGQAVVCAHGHCAATRAR